MIDVNKNWKANIWIPLLFLIARLVLLISLPPKGIQSYGDFWNFFHLAGLGQPFRDLWVEFPPLFPFLSRGIYLIVGGREHSYIYLSVIIFSVIQAGTVFLFQKIAEMIWGPEKGLKMTVFYSFLVLGLFYSWAYFDCLAVFLTMLGLYLLARSKEGKAGLALGLGGLVKWFPILALPAAWKWLGWKKGLRTLLSGLIVIFITWTILYGISPDMTRASLISQGAKGSWESIWALVDGNLNTGNFPPGADRLDPATATLSSGNPAIISPWITLLVFGGFGAYLFLRAEVKTVRQLVAFSGLTLIMFFLWSPGYSPQWMLFILPLIMLVVEENRNYLIAVTVVLVNLLEWPIMLSRGLFQGLPGLIVLRSLIYVLIAVLLIRVVLPGNSSSKEILS